MDTENNPTFIQQIAAKISYWVLDTIQTIVMALAVFVVVYLFVFQPNQVKGSSMVPTLHDSEYVLTDKLTYRWLRKPQAGDIVVFQAPENEKFDFIKRVIALSGDTVELRDGVVYVNNQPLAEPYLPLSYQTNGGAFLVNNQRYLVPEGGYVVMGDNRRFSSDSREWGPVPTDHVIGRAWFRYWPPNKIGTIGLDSEARGS